MIVKKGNGTRKIADSQLGIYEKKGYEPVEKPAAKKPEAENGSDKKSEYELLKEEAAALGIDFNGNIGKAKLKELIEQKKAGQSGEKDGESDG